MEETSAEQQPAKQQPEQPQSAAADSRHAAAAASIARSNNRGPSDIRPIRFLNDIAPHAAGSTLIEWGATRVICGATVEEGVPRWMREQGLSGGWITAEYAMLPYSTQQRKPREASRGRQEGRSQEIQRLIGRSMRAAADLEKLGQRTIWIDADVLQADGGTRTAAITGGFVALALAIRKLLAAGILSENPIRCQIAAVSVGIVQGQVRLDLNYEEDVAAEVDMNVVMNSRREFIEIQGTAERRAFTERQLSEMLAAARTGLDRLFQLQREALGWTAPPTAA